MADLIKYEDDIKTGTDKLNASIRDANKAKEDSKEALLKAVQSMDLSEQTQLELTQAILAGDSSPLGGQLSVGADSTVYPGPQERLIAEYNKTVTQLAEKAKYLSNLASSGVKNTGGSISKLDSVIPTLVFIDDDARNELYTKWFPYVKQKGIVISAAVITNRIDKDGSHVTSAQLKEMHDSGFIELCNHTKDHVHLANLTDEEIHEQIRDAQRFLENMGVYTKHLVYPFGSLDARVREIATLYVDSATQSNDRFNQVNTGLLDSYKMSRIVLERPLETHKQMIDDIVSQNGLMIINTHSQYPEFSTSKVDEIVDYAKSKGVDITTITTAFNRFRNFIEFKGNEGVTSGISATGYGVGYFEKEENVYEYVNSTNLQQSTPITAYKQNKITTTHMTTAEANANGWELGAGVLFTDRRSRDEYSYQEFHPINSSKIFKRSWRVSRDEWYPFENVNGTKSINYTTSSEAVIEAGKRRNYTVEGLSATSDNVLIVNPAVKMPSGIIVDGMVSATGEASIEVTNTTNQSITIPAQTVYKVKII